MKEEDKDLLLKELCGRLPYGVYFIGYKVVFGGTDITIFDKEKMLGIVEDTLISQSGSFSIEKVKPYLRPMSSMTEDEEEEYRKINLFGTHWGFVDWCNKKHFDYRGLIEKGLAIKVTDEDNPYEKH